MLEHASEGATIRCPTCGQPLQVPVPEMVLPYADPEPGVVRPVSMSRRRLRGRERYCPECGAVVDVLDRYCPECDSRQYHRRRNLEPHRGTLILVLGVLSLVMAQVILGPIAWIMGNEDLKKIRAGKMDPEGESPTNTGRICGIIGTIIGGVILLLFLLWFLVVLLVIGTVVSNGPPPRGW
jgi:hypothetical protein